MTEEEKLNIKKQFCDIIKEGIAPILDFHRLDLTD